MSVKNSLRNKMVIAFSLVIAPLVIFLYLITLYSMDVVRVQVAQSNRNLLSTYVNQMDQSLADITNYLYKQILNDTNIKSLGFYESESENYDFSKVSIINKMDVDLNYYNDAGAFFVYTKETDHFMVSYRNYEIFSSLDPIIKPLIMNNGPSTSWTIVPSGSEYGLVKIVTNDSKIYVGAWVPLSNMTKKMQHIDFGGKGDVFLVSKQSTPLTATSLSESGMIILQNALSGGEQPYSILKDPSDHSSRLTVWMKLKLTDMYIVISIPEKSVLLQLPFFKQLIYLIPIICLLILSVYFVILRRILLLPMSRLLSGMRKMIQGDLNVRLKEDKSSEFSFLILTFNQMVADIRDLKINMYEEKIKVKEAEFKHLQAQINPHFYLNALNIVYNSAVLKEYETIKTISLHLADYFRFRIRTNREEVSLEEEMIFIESYLVIQKLRFLEFFSYTLHMSPIYGNYPIPPLLVQPFVENCIIHGFKGNTEHLHIDIRIQPSKDLPETFFEIVVTDNGPGFPIDKLALMNTEDFFIHSKDPHIGIWNVYHRMKMKYGDEASLQFTNELPQGATVILRIPYQLDLTA